MVLESASRFLFSFFRFLGDWSSRVAQVRREFPVFHLPGTSEREARARCLAWLAVLLLFGLISILFLIQFHCVARLA